MKNTLSIKGSEKLLREQRDLSLQKRSDKECDLFTSYFRRPEGIHHYTKGEGQESQRKINQLDSKTMTKNKLWVCLLAHEMTWKQIDPKIEAL